MRIHSRRNRRRGLNASGEPVGASGGGGGEEVLGVAFVVGDGAELPLGVGVESLGPGESTSVHLRALDRGGAKRLAVGAGDHGAIGGGEVVEDLVVGGEADDALESLASTLKRALARVQVHTLNNDFIGVLGHGWKYVEQRLLVAGEIQEERVGLSRGGEGVAGKEDIEQANANGPDVCRSRGVSSTGRVELLRGHVTLASNRRLVRPLLGGGKPEVTQLGRASRGEEEVLRLDVAVVDALGVDVGNSVDKLQHESPHMLGFQRTLVATDRFVQIASLAVLENDVGVGLGLEGVDEVDNVGVGSKTSVKNQLLRLLVNRKVEAGFACSSLLCQALDGNLLTSLEVAGHEDHAERPMVEGGDRFVSASEEDSRLELVPKAEIHGEC